MSPVSLIQKLGAKGIKLWLDGEQLKFKAPKGALNAELKAELIENKAAVIQFLVSIEANQDAPEIKPTKRVFDEAYPLSFSQQRFWFLDQLQSGDPSLHVPVALQLVGDLDIALLEQAFNILALRHESLRTYFSNEQGQHQRAQQFISESVNFNLQEDYDLSHLDAEQSNLSLEKIAKEEALRPFDLNHGKSSQPLFIRCKIAKLAGCENGEPLKHILFITLHHIICDGLSLNNLIQQLAENYSLLVNKTAIPFKPTTQYVDFSAYQLAWMQSKKMPVELNWWRDALQNSEVLQLPGDFTRPMHVGHQGEKLNLELDDKLSQDIIQYANQNKTTSFIFMLSVFQLLLARYTKQSSFCIGTPVHGRSEEGLSEAVGCFINLLAIPCQINTADNMNGEDLIRATHDFFMLAQDYQTIPFDVLAEEIDFERSSAHTPLFQVLFTQRTHSDTEAISFSGLDFSVLEQQSYTSKYDLQLHVQQTNNSIVLSIEYNTQLFLPATITTLLRHYVNLAQALVADHQLDISQLQLLDALDFQELNVFQSKALPEIVAESFKSKTLISHFEKQLISNAEAIAVNDGEQSLSYQQLHDESIKLAKHLQRKNIGLGSRVGLCLAPNRFSIIGILACLRLSASYVPMDINHPVERLQFIAEDAELNIILMESRFSRDLQLEPQIPLLAINQLDDLALDLLSVELPAVSSAEEDKQCLYVIYTSGSTGTPKGAMVSYANEKHLLDWYINEYTIDVSSKTIIVSSLGFDLTQKNLLAPLMVGGGVYFTESNHYDPLDILNCINQHKINRINCAPSAFYPVLATAERRHHLDYLSSLSHVLFGGETIAMAHLQNWLRGAGRHVKLINMYGPTECTDISCAYTIQDINATTIPIGYAIPGVECLVLDEQQNILPVGLTGELYIGGASLGMGYLNNEQLNKETFIQHPLDANKKIYRSKDFVRYQRSDKGLVLDFISRADDQVKIRGFRIELGEITNQLLKNENIKEATVIVSKLAEQDKLLAYIVLDDNQSMINFHELRQSLKQYLPEYMLPNAFIRLEALPLSANGKIDKKQLPAVTDNDFIKREYVSARNLTEAQLVEMWQDILQIENISIYDDFFELGGHSLLATQLIARIAEEFAIEISLKDFFNQPSIAECALSIHSGDLVEAFTHQQPITVADRSQPLPLSFAQERLWVIEKITQGNSAYNIPAALHLVGKLNLAAFEKTLLTIVDRHESLRTTFSLSEQGEPVQVIAAKGGFQLKHIDLSDQPQPQAMESAQALFDEDAACPFDIAIDALFRASLIKIAADEYVLIATMHHIISDGWSMSVLQKELVTHYEAFYQQASVNLPELDFQYADFSVWQREQFNEEHISSHLDFWQQELANIPPHITLPIDKPRPKQQTFNGSVVSRVLPQTVSKELLAYSQTRSNTAFNILLSVFALLLNKHARQNDICIGTPVAGREQKSLESLIGYFVNAVVLRCQLDGNPSFSKLVDRLQDTSLSAFANQTVPIEKVLELIEIERNPAYSPVTQVGFSYIGKEFTVKAQLPELEVNYLDFNVVVAKYDLTLIIIDDGDSIRCDFEYNTDLFNQATVETFAEDFESLLNQALSEPDLSIYKILQPSQKLLSDALEVDASQVEKIMPLTAMQRDMVLGQLIKTTSLANTLGYRAEVAVDIDPEKWRQAFQLVSDKQPICRTLFLANKMAVGDDYYQCVLNSQPVNFECMDLRGENLADIEIDKRVNAFIYQPQCYQQDIFIRIGLLKTEQRDILLLSSHHALLDGVSIVLIAQATAAYYEALANGDDLADVADLPDNFEEYLYKDLELTDERSVKDFWQQELQDCESLNFSLLPKVVKKQSTILEGFKPTSQVREEGLQLDDYQSQKIQRLNFSAKHWLEIKKYCRSNKITPPQYFKLLYSLLISQYCCADAKFSITEFSAGRDRSNAFSLGCFFKQSPYLFDADKLGKETTIENLFKQQRAFRKKAKQALNISASLTAALQETANLQFMFNYYHFFPTDQTLQGQAIKCIEMPPFIESAVQFVVKEQGDFVSFDLYFQESSFNDLHFLERLEALSAQLVQQAENLHQLSYLLPIEFVQQVYHANKPQSALQYVALSEKFEAQVEKFPAVTAIQDDKETLSYKALNDRANGIAHQLQAMGVGANIRIAFCLPRSVDAVAIILAVIKVGATYVPIDKSYPADRVKFILKASEAHIVFLEPNHTLDVSEFSATTLLIEQGVVAGVEKAASTDNLAIKAHEDDVLYIIFTSGSTGEPKGAAVSYANEMNLMHWYSEGFEFSSSKVCVFSPLGFDLTQKNLLAPLLQGGELVLLAGDYDSELVLNTIKKNQITHVNCAPSLFYPLIEDYSETQLIESLASLKVVSFGGEALQLSRLRKWLSLDDFNCDLYNHYGPTECTDIALFHKLDRADALGSDYVPLGKANTAVQTFIMNKHLQLLPAGVVGEICVAGAGVGLGYINSESSNLEKFVSNPLGAGKLYRTGDLGRYDSNFDIEFIGRKDHQLKLNGLRIEPGEIEFQLKQIDGVQDALVQVVDQQLVAYLLSAQLFDLNVIQKNLAQVLPNYMLPKHIECLAAWPLTANGKIDRTKLPSPSEKIAVEYVAPNTDIEKALCEILEHVLTVAQVGIHDNFFDLGGHSLAASRAIVQVRQLYNVDIPLHVLFEMTTVEKLAAWIAASQWAQQSAENKHEEEGRDSGFI